MIFFATFTINVICITKSWHIDICREDHICKKWLFATSIPIAYTKFGWCLCLRTKHIFINITCIHTDSTSIFIALFYTICTTSLCNKYTRIQPSLSTSWLNRNSLIAIIYIFIFLENHRATLFFIGVSDILICEKRDSSIIFIISRSKKSIYIKCHKAFEIAGR